jgi:hypothetical protein
MYTLVELFLFQMPLPPSVLQRQQFCFTAPRQRAAKHITRKACFFLPRPGSDLRHGPPANIQTGSYRGIWQAMLARTPSRWRQTASSVRPWAFEVGVWVCGMNPPSCGSGLPLHQWTVSSLEQPSISKDKGNDTPAQSHLFCVSMWIEAHIPISCRCVCLVLWGCLSRIAWRAALTRALLVSSRAAKPRPRHTCGGPVSRLAQNSILPRSLVKSRT